MKIYAPVKSANGVYASVRFVNGVGETNNPALIEWFRKHGYRVEKCESSSENHSEKCVESQRVEMIPTELDESTLDAGHTDQPNFDAMTPLELREWARANGFGGVIKNTRSKEKLLELIRG